MKTPEDLASQCVENANATKRLLTCLMWFHACLIMLTGWYIYITIMEIIHPKPNTVLWLNILAVVLNVTAVGVNVWRMVEIRKEIPEQWDMWMLRRQECLDLK